MSARIADLIFRLRYALCAFIAVGFFALLPLTNLTAIDNDITTWISRDDPVYQTYERFREEFGGQRTLLIAIQSDRLFTPESLAFIREVTEEIERVETVQRVQSIATANIVTTLPPSGSADDDGGIEVQPLLDDVLDQAEAERVRTRALGDELLRGDLVSEDGTVTALVVSFDEDRIDDVRAGVIEQIHQIVDPVFVERHEDGGHGAVLRHHVPTEQRVRQNAGASTRCRLLIENLVQQRLHLDPAIVIARRRPIQCL